MNLVEALNEIPDFRRKQGLRFPMSCVLIITIMSTICGRCGYREIAKYADANKKALLNFFNLKRKKLPSHVTFREIVKNLDFKDVMDAFHNWAAQYVEIEKNEWFSIDGKALKSTVTDYSDAYQNFVSLVSVFSHKRGQVLKVAKLENKKSSEIPTVVELIQLLDLQDVVFSLDALHCQKKL
jgi:hypothetical protein